MSETLGERLRRRREEQGIALGTIAEQTKIKLSLLEGLERDDVSRWPSGIFRRAYLRAYAQSIGLSPDAILPEFLAVHPDPDRADAAEAAVRAAADRAEAAAGPPSRLRYIVGSAIGSLSRRLEKPGGTTISAAGVSALAEPVAALPSGQPEAPPPAGRVAACDDAPPVRGRAADEAPLDLEGLARLCTSLGRTDRAEAIEPLLRKAAHVLDATGLVVWMWDSAAAVLRPVFAEGYSDRVLAHLPAVRRDAENPTATAFRSARTCAVEGDDGTTGALVVPLLTPSGCSGVLALELPHGRERSGSVRAAAEILAALMAQLIGGAESDEMPPEQAAGGGRVRTAHEPGGADSGQG